ncbi:hypothetical protein BGX38DRAFT_1277441 [Terfezia claveryi]|nr:hypothetical protein BGX38DRAFT_1277441 [Terfezia claveryi]
MATSVVESWELSTEYQQKAEILKLMVKLRSGKDMYPFQIRAAMAILMGRDVACVAGTSSGKSLAF